MELELFLGEFRIKLWSMNGISSDVIESLEFLGGNFILSGGIASSVLLILTPILISSEVGSRGFVTETSSSAPYSANFFLIFRLPLPNERFISLSFAVVVEDSEELLLRCLYFVWSPIPEFSPSPSYQTDLASGTLWGLTEDSEDCLARYRWQDLRRPEPGLFEELKGSETLSPATG
jgi:hypothetical protein